MTAKPESALIIVGHGSTVNPDSSEPTFEQAERIRGTALFGEVHCAFWKEEPSLRQVLHMLERDDVYIVPNFISEGYFTRTVIPRELELTGAVTQRAGLKLKYCEPTGSHPSVTEFLLHRAAEAAPAVDPRETSLIIVGHGTELNENSAAAAKREVAKIRERGIYAETLSAYMEEAPLVSDWDVLASQRNVVVTPFFISDGLHSYQDIPVMLGIDTAPGPAASRRDVFRRNPHFLRGRSLYYAGALGADPEFYQLVLDQVVSFDEAHARNGVLCGT